MILKLFIVLTAFSTGWAGLNHNAFPKLFKFGVSTSAYQIEGAWNEDGRGPSIWDDFAHDHPESIQDHSNGNIACDSYHLYDEDVRLLSELGVQFYRLSISWSRVLPNGSPIIINQKGVDYYRKLLKLLVDNGIEPIVTLYHGDLPSPLQDIGGWTNPDIVDYFGEYVRVCYKYFGEYVKYWMTLNEPQSTCFYGYAGNTETLYSPPGYNLEAEGVYLCAYTQVKAHAVAYHIYDNEFKAKQGGKVSLALTGAWFEPPTNTSDDLEGQELALQFSLGMFAHPVFLGNWPQLIIDRVSYRSQIENLPQSRLPEFTQEEIDYIRGTYDWYGLNYYVSKMVKKRYNQDDLPGNASFFVDQGFEVFDDPSWKTSNTSSWLVQVPWGLTKMLKWIHDNYNQPEIIITENGWSDNGSSMNDSDRIDYVNEHLSAILDAIDEGVNVVGYNQWSFMDNFEWSNGYTCKFGVVYVNFTDSNRTRTPKESFHWYQNVIKSRCLTDVCSENSGSILNHLRVSVLLSLITTVVLNGLFLQF